MRTITIKRSLCLASLCLAVALVAMGTGQAAVEKDTNQTSSVLYRVQTETDPELAELIRIAVANRGSTGELEIVRRVTQGYAQTKLLDLQIAQITRTIESTAGPAEVRQELLLAKMELELKRTTEIANLREAMGIVPKFSFAMQPTEDLNTWVSLQPFEQRVVVLEGLKEFSELWYRWRHKVVGVLSQRETLEYLRGRFTDKQSLPMRIYIYYMPETESAGETLRNEILSLARETNAAMDTEVRLQRSVWVGSGESPFFLREGKITTFYPFSVARPDGDTKSLISGLVDPNDLEQHILWRLTMPKNLPVTFRIEYDEASSQLARNVADTAKAVAGRLGLADLVSVVAIPVEPVPEKAFLGKWQALGNGILQSLDIRSGGTCHVTVGEGSRAIRAGTSVRGTWTWTVREILLDINDTIDGKVDYPPYRYRVTVGEAGDLVVERGEIYPQGSWHRQGGVEPMVFRKVD